LDHSSKSAALRGGVLFAALQISTFSIAASPSFAASKKPAAKAAPAAKATAAPKTAAAAVSPVVAASAAKGKAAIAKVESQFDTAKTFTLTSTVTGSGPGAAATPIVLTSTMERPGYISAEVTREGKSLGKIAVGPDGGVIYDAVGNRYAKIAKGDTPIATLRDAMRSVQGLWPSDAAISLFLTTAFMMQKHPILIEAPQGSKVNVATRSFDGTLNGAAVSHVTQTVAQGQMSTIVDVYINKATNQLARLSYGGSMNGKPAGGLQADFSSFKTAADAAPASTFEFTPPATATAYTPPAQPEEQPILANGAAAPNFEVQDVAGHSVHLADFAGKVVVIDFWSTWCGPCQQSLPGTDKIAKKYQAKDVVFLPVCSWDDKSAFTPWVNQRKSWTMKFYFDPAGKADNNIAATMFKVSGIPTQFVIGKDGKVAAGFVGYEGEESEKSLTSAIDKALAGS